MQTAITSLDRTASVEERKLAPSARATDWRLGIPTYIYAVVLSSLFIVWGLLWDIMWHMSIGRDGLFSAPHVMMYIGAVVAGVFSGAKILQLTFLKQHPMRGESIRFWGVFYGSLGALICVWGAFAMLTSAPFDDWWHNTYGLDVQILTPPHTILAFGMMAVQFGAMIGALALQNRFREVVLTDSAQKKQARRLRVMFGIASGFLLSAIFTLFSENMDKDSAHHSSYYINAAIVFPIYLLAVGRASLLRYPITTISAVYMLTMLIPSWILPLFPATPRLGPILYPITHYQAFVFPLLLIVPGFFLDKLMQRFSYKKMNDWALAGLLAVVFMGVLLAVQWMFGAFLLESPYARNAFFFSNSWYYGSDPSWPYRYRFNPENLQSSAAFLKGFGIALVCAFFSARIGLAWGSWMKQVQR